MIIGEIKKFSKIQGLLKEIVDPVKLAKSFIDNGVSAISVLTSQANQGDKQWITAIRKITNIPILRQDYINTVDDIIESKELGATWITLAPKNDHNSFAELLFYANKHKLKPIGVFNSPASLAFLIKHEDIQSVMYCTPFNDKEKTYDFGSLNGLVESMDLEHSNLELYVTNGLESNWLYTKTISGYGMIDYYSFGDYLMASTDLTESFKTITRNIIPKTTINEKNRFAKTCYHQIFKTN